MYNVTRSNAHTLLCNVRKLMTHTLLQYLDNNKSVSFAQITNIITNEMGTALILDQTIFYPQGGGQPSDQGFIKNIHSQDLFNVTSVRFMEGAVYHYGTFMGNKFFIDDHVELTIDSKRRKLNSQNHTAGHIIDIAIRSLDLPIVPNKGYHFPEGPYVEYQQTQSDPFNATEHLEYIQRQVNNILSTPTPVSCMNISYNELVQVSGYVPTNLPADKPTRVMKINGYPAIPCGGTHVDNTRDITNIIVKKISKKSGMWRVSYQVS